MLKINAQGHSWIEKVNERYKVLGNKNRKQHVYNDGELIWLHLRNVKFPSKNKLMPLLE